MNQKTIAKVALHIAEQKRTGISLISAGRTDDHFSLEDFICAGAITQKFPADETENSDAVLAAMFAFQRAHKSLTRFIQSGHHAVHLKNLGFEQDIKYCCRLDVSKIVPFFNGEVIVPRLLT